MKKQGFTAALRGTLFSAFSGNTGDVSGSTDADVHGMLMAIGGPGKTKSGIDLTAAANELGVTRRTVERWVTTAGERNKLRGANLSKVVAKSRQAATTQKGRRRAVARIRNTGGPGGSSTARYGSKITLKGTQGPAAAGKDYLRDRSISLQLDPESAQGMFDAYAEGGDKGFVGWMEGYAGDTYVDGWSIGSIDSFQIGE